MLHDKPCIQFCLFVHLLAIGHTLLSYAHVLVKLAQRSNAFASGVVPCVILSEHTTKQILDGSDSNIQFKRSIKVINLNLLRSKNEHPIYTNNLNVFGFSSNMCQPLINY